MDVKTSGLMNVDWEERVNMERLRTERLARISKLLAESEMGALLCFRHEQYSLHYCHNNWYMGF